MKTLKSYDAFMINHRGEKFRVLTIWESPESVLKNFVLQGYKVKYNKIYDFEWCNAKWNIDLIFNNPSDSMPSVRGFRLVNMSTYLNTYILAQERLSELQSSEKEKSKKTCNYIDLGGQYKTIIDWLPFDNRAIKEIDGTLYAPYIKL